jgi:uncharacterized protein
MNPSPSSPGRWKRSAAVLSVTLLLLCGGRLALAIPSDDLLNSLTATADVNDFAKLLTTDQKAILEARCQRLREKTGSQLAVVILRSLQGGEVDDFTNKLFAKWKVGQAGKDNGVMLLVAIDDHKARIETGYGLEPVLPDILTQRILQEQLIPQFRQQRYFEGLHAAVNRIAEIVEKGEPAANVIPAVKMKPFGFSPALLIFLFMLVVVPSAHAGQALRQRQFGPALTTAGFVGLCILGTAILATTVVFVLTSIASPIAAAFGYLSDSSTGGGGGRRYRRTGMDDGWLWNMPSWTNNSSGWSGGGFGGGGGSWGGFGGGSSGGGGSSASW